METLEKVEELLTKLLERKEEELEELREKIYVLEAEVDYPNWKWMRHCEVKDEEGLPVPRLEMRYIARGYEGREWHNYDAQYNLVYRHFMGELTKIPLGATKIDGGGGKGPSCYKGNWGLPVRDGAHIHHDAEELNLPIYVVIEPAGKEHPVKVIEEVTGD